LFVKTTSLKTLEEVKHHMIRIQLELPEDRVQELDELAARLRIRTRKDLLNTALTLLEWAAAEKAAGKKIASVDVENQVLRELVMPGLESLSNRRDPEKVMTA
jgi:hypothetical protein